MLEKSKVVIFFLLCCPFDGISGQDEQYINVTLAVFSGRPDPQWVLLPTNQHFSEIKSLLDEAREDDDIYKSTLMPPRLGYKGYLIQDWMQKDPELIIGLKTVELQTKLFDTLPKGWLQGKYLKKFFNQMKKEIISGKITALTEAQLQNIQEQVSQQAIVQQEKQEQQQLRKQQQQPKQEERQPAGRRKRYAYRYTPVLWNNIITNTYAQPGRGSGSQYTAYSTESVRNAAVNDHLEFDQNVIVNNFPLISIHPPNGKQHLVYLVINPGIDYHWLRLDENGRWSHKIGRAPATDLDNANTLITDPRNSYLGGYILGVGFLKSNKDDITIA